jgi:hypothetical protein
MSRIISGGPSAIGIDPLPGGENQSPTLDHTPSATLLSVDPTTPRRPSFRVQGQRRWVPSTTKLSFETIWWGYRMYVYCSPVDRPR